MYHIGLDAGGTKTHAAIVDSNENIIFEMINGPGNVTVNYTDARENIREAVKACLKSEHGKYCEFIVMGVAGIEKGNLKLLLEEYLNNEFQLPILLLNDAELAYYSTLGNSNGILAIAGTGSVFLGKNNSDIFTVGGWGHLLGDQGSSYDIGLHALKLIIYEIDQGGIQTAFSKSLASEYKLYHSSHIKEFVYSSSKAEIAEIAYFIYKLAKAENEHALNILEQAGEKLVSQSLQLIKRLKLKSPIKIGCRGSLLEKNEIVQTCFINKLRQHSVDISPIFNDKPVVVGALPAWKSRMEEN